MPDAEISFQFQPVGKAGKGNLCARAAGRAIHTAKLDLTDPSARRRFIKAVLKEQPHLNRREMTRAFEELAGEVVNSASEQARLTQAGALVELASSAELFHHDDTGYATIDVATAQPDGKSPDDAGARHRETHPIHRKGFRSWLTRRFYEKHGKVPGSQAMQEAVEVLASQALYNGPPRPVAVRLARHGDAIYLDLANDRWQAVKITAAGWKVVSKPPVKFLRRRGMQPLPIPVRGGSIDELRPLINAGDDAGWRLIAAWLVGSLRPEGPYAVLALNGQQGSGKSMTCKMLRQLIDPNEADVRSAPRDERDLMIAATNAWLVTFDNLSRIPPPLADSLCRLATGSGFATRELYTDDGEKLFYAARPILFNGIEELATRPDLLDRSIVLNLPTIPDKDRKPEADLRREYEQVRPRVLGALLDAVVEAMKWLPTVRLKKPPRMADFAAWVVAAEGVLPWKPGAFLTAYEDSRSDANALAAESSAIGPLLLRFMGSQSRWTGTVKSLLSKLAARADYDTRRRFDWPKSPRGLAGALKRLAPALPAVGIKVTFGGRGRDGYTITLEQTRGQRSQRSQPRSESDTAAEHREHAEHAGPPKSKQRRQRGERHGHSEPRLIVGRASSRPIVVIPARCREATAKGQFRPHNPTR